MIRSSSLLTFCCCLLAIRAGAADFSSLLNNSPFAPVGAGAAAAGDKSVEYRGRYTESGVTFFSILDTATQRATWVAMNESGHPFVVRGYNQASDSVTVELNGHNLNLSLKLAQVQLAAAPKPTAPTGPANTQQPDNPRGRWMANMAAPDGRPDPQRMQAFIEEMRRRRSQRGQGGAQDNGMPPVGTGMPVPNATVTAGPGPAPMPAQADPNNPNAPR